MFKEVLISVLKWFAKLFGIRKNSKYVSNYLNDANIRSSIFMSFIIIVLEIWLIIRQTNKYIIPRWKNFETILDYASLFILFLLIGLSLLVFALTYKNNRISRNQRFILNAVISGSAFIFSFYLIRELFKLDPKSWQNQPGFIANILLIVLYATAFILSFLVFVYSYINFKYRIEPTKLSFGIIIAFAAMCLAFGVRVSYSDHISASRIDNVDKEIICFLTMVIYVACLLVWKPYISILLNTLIFVGFYLLIVRADTSNGELIYNIKIGDVVWQVPAPLFNFKDGDRVNYITFFVSLTTVTIMMYHQRLDSAIKDEELVHIAEYDELTGLHNFSYFVRTLDEEMKNPDFPYKSRVVLFVNIQNFKIYNQQRGFVKGNEFLGEVGKILTKHFDGDSIICRQSDDHYVIATELDGFEVKLRMADEDIAALDEDVKAHICAGMYIIKNEEDVRRMADKARYASHVASSKVKLVLEYDKNMHNEYHLMQYVIHNIDKAAEEGWIRPYYQPVVWSKDGTLCGAEALARWIDPVKGILPPYSFVPTLENTKLIYKVDVCIVESVFRDLRATMDAGLKPIPISVNFSRLDFEAIDIVKLLDEMVEKYNVPKKYVHVEITESALMDDTSLLTEVTKRLKEKEYSLWLDDFGSGYSSLNVLKDYEFDVLKIDMKFLSGFEHNLKARPLIESVISMAEKMGMKTLAEGVETKEQMDFLNDSHCGRLQGYLFGRPIPFEDLNAKIANGELKISNTLF